jgi:hypothetical protein
MAASVLVLAFVLHMAIGGVMSASSVTVREPAATEVSVLTVGWSDEGDVRFRYVANFACDLDQGSNSRKPPECR